MSARIAAFSALAGTVFAGPAWGDADAGRAAEIIVEKTNAFRKGERLGPVQPHERLAAAARDFAAYMAKNGKLDHEADGRKPAERAKAGGYAYCIVAENIGYQYRSGGFGTAELAETFVEGWKASPGHRRNLVDGQVAHIGVGIARERKGGYYAVQMFGLPESRSIRFEVRNESRTTLRYGLGDRAFSVAPRARQLHTTCGPEKIRFHLPGDDKALETADDARFVATEQRGRVTIAVR